MKKNASLYILTAVAIALVAGVFLYSLVRFVTSQREVNRGLWRAAKFANAPAAAYWLAKGADVHARDEHGAVGLPKQSALHMCAHLGSHEIVELLLLTGADPNAVDAQGRTPLHHVNFESVAKLLIRYGASLDSKDKQGDNPLQCRLRNGWYLPDELAATLRGDTPDKTLQTMFEERQGMPSSNTYPPSKGDYVKNKGDHGEAFTWGIAFYVESPQGSGASSSFEGELHSDPNRTDARNTFTMGDDVEIQLEKKPNNPISFTMNNQSYGTLDLNDRVIVDRNRRVKVNDRPREAAEPSTLAQD